MRTDIKVGSEVHDDLTGKKAKITRLFKSGPNEWDAVELDDTSWLGGQRYIWEITTKEDHTVPNEISEYECPACGHKTVVWDEYKNHFHFCEEER